MKSQHFSKNSELIFNWFNWYLFSDMLSDVIIISVQIDVFE